MAAPLTTDALVWIRASNGEEVDNAIVGGISDRGSAIYIARAQVRDNLRNELATGSLPVGHDCAYIPLGGKELRVNDYEVLCNPYGVRILWIAWTGKKLPAGAVQCGTDAQDMPIYVARHCDDGNLIPGKFKISSGNCYIAWNGKERIYREYEMLCVSSVLPGTNL